MTTPAPVASPIVRRTAIFINPDRSRVFLQPFTRAGEERIAKIIEHLLALPEAEVERLLHQVLREFSGRRRTTRELFLERFGFIRPHLVAGLDLSESRRLLIGSYFTHEYSLEAAALFTPALVRHPDQSELPPGALRFVLSLRATGEGRVSSLTFRTGVIGPDNAIGIGPPTRYVTEPTPVPGAMYARSRFERRLSELGLADEFARRTMAALAERFSLDELRGALALVQRRTEGDARPGAPATAAAILELALSNYQLRFPADLMISERVRFPRPPSQSHGIDDTCFVSFLHDDGTRAYFAAYIARAARTPKPDRLETSDFLDLTFVTPGGAAVANKGMALFPRKIGGRHAMLSRQDAENIFVLFSDDLHFWSTRTLVLKPAYDWEFVQVGHCGSPIETERGWLVLSHGMGAPGKYSIGAFLLDLADPTKVLGRLREPLITPAEDERDGYMPDTVYSCGALLHGRELIIPYSVSDHATRFATVSLDAVLAAMV